MPGGSSDPLPPSPTIAGFDLVAHAWVIDAAPADRCAPLPLLSGRLMVDVAAQVRALDEAGRPARRLVAAMLLPGAIGDIVKMMRFCDEHGIAVTSANAAGHADPGPIVRIRADSLGCPRPVLRVVGSDH